MNFLSESELERSFERFDLFKNTPKHLAQLFDDSFLRNQNYTIRQDKAFSTVFANCREEYIELISTKSPDQLTQDEKKELMARANDMENKMYDYMMAWEKRYGSTAETFLHFMAVNTLNCGIYINKSTAILHQQLRLRDRFQSKVIFKHLDEIDYQDLNYPG